MQDGSFTADRRRNLTGGGITQLAVDAVARLVAREDVTQESVKEPIVLRLLEVVRMSDVSAFDRFRTEQRRARISDARLADLYIPEAARRLGREWEDDKTSFADVTIGVARLQGLLRDIGMNWAADDADKAGVATMLVILPSGEQHTLGALVISGWLRRRGISVCLRLAPSRQELSDLLSVRQFDGVMMSLSGHSRLTACAEMVKTIRQAASNGVRIAVGGTLLDSDEGVAAATGADIVTNDLSAALEGLGLSSHRRLLTVAT